MGLKSLTSKAHWGVRAALLTAGANMVQQQTVLGPPPPLQPTANQVHLSLPLASYRPNSLPRAQVPLHMAHFCP